MDNLKFLAYLSTEGLTTDEAKNAVIILEDHIEQLEALTTIEPLAEVTKVKWERGADGKMELSGEIEKRCMDLSKLTALPANLERLSKARALKKWLERAIEYMECVTRTYNIAIGNNYDNIYDIYYFIMGTPVSKYMCDLLFGLLPEPPKLQKIDEKPLTDADVMATLSPDELARYYAAQAAAATIGDFVHPDGSYSEARMDLVDKLANPSEIQAEANTTTIKRYIPNMTLQDVDKMYFTLQALQRDFQKGVNSQKYKAEDAVNDSERQHYERRQQVETANRDKVNEYTKTVNALAKQINDEASKLYIAVPRDARTFLDELLSASDDM